MAALTASIAIAASALGALLFADRRRLRAEVALQSTIDSVGHGVATFASGRLIAWNSAFVDLLALAPGVMTTGRPAWAIEQAERAKTDPMLGDLTAQAGLARQRERPVLVEHQRSDGTIVELAFRPHREDGFTLSVTDITARRRSGK